jgi:hypothetical protein
MVKKTKIDPKISKKVWDEFNSLVASRDELSAKEMISLRSYVKARTDLKVSEEKLTDEEKVWKTCYTTLNTTLGKNV